MHIQSPSVAVLLAAYNGARWIEEQLDSIRAQKNINVSIFISVDISSDETQRICDRYAQKYSNVHILPPADRFGGAAKNFYRLIKDIDFTPYAYVAFSDQDDIWYPEKLLNATTVLSGGEFDAYSSNVIAFWPDGRRALVDKAQQQVEWDYLFEAAGPGCTYVLCRPLADAFKCTLIRYWDKAQNISLHDWYCYAFARSNGFRWFIDPTPGMDYRQHNSNQLGANNGILSHSKRLKKIFEGWWGSQVLLIDNLTGMPSSLLKKEKGSKRLVFISLVLKAYKCRRRRKDQLLFVFACLITAVSKSAKTI
ncbi:glycosyltransferase [Pseudomonas alliivorans]|nr:glycosyltransferase [Pseudomonas alliivorans]MEE4795218.1 glycosyltransferase [Pseudomonas alliivorans]MEE4800245.1 glycosyltransferase [Pseudomonas alliivorans]MEE4808275.1 glycosyltransferase [Pseudomonas alliivorans]MEE4825274.1 glycosyltransferase [Pseudomonas alliivorans]